MGMTRQQDAIGVLEGMTDRARQEADAALAAFVDDHYGRLLGLARLICRDGSDAADAVQIGLEQAWRHRASIQDGARVRPWLDRIVVREAVRLSTRRRSRIGRLLTLSPELPQLDPPDGRASQPAAYAALRVAFATLSGDQRAVVALHLHLGYSVAETARIVGAPEETVRSRLRLARGRLRRELEEAQP